MITHFYIDNFKSLVNFDLELSKFTCLIGLNGAGKSTVLQALDFASALMVQGGVSEWLKQRGWSVNDVASNITKRKLIKLAITAEVVDGSGKISTLIWAATFDLTKQCCIRETLVGGVLCFFESDGQVYSTGNCRYSEPYAGDIDFQYQGSLLSQLNPNRLNGCMQLFKDHLTRLRAFDAFSPDYLRLPSAKNASNNKNDIGVDGALLAKFIRELSPENKAHLLASLQTYYPQVTAINTRLLLSTETIELEVVEQHGDGQKNLKTKARHINDGMLRMLAILAEQFSPLETLLFDEIENGINPEVIEKVVDALVASPKQIIVTTHSPMLLNYMSDEVAKEAVMLIYKNRDGSTHATRFFDVPSAAHKLKSLAPGDAMLDVYLDNIAQEAESHHAA
jgi:predicted ATPase